MQKRNRRLAVLSLALVAGIVAAYGRHVSADGQDEVRFNRDIRPIFADTCFRCHGPDKGARKANLRLDIREEAIKKTKSGIIPIVPGKPGESEVVHRILSTDKAEVMPPEEIHKPLTETQKRTIDRWIAQGAKYEGHWAYQPVNRAAPPAIAGGNPIDAFIQARLSKEGLKPSAEADRATLIRRVSLDLTGVPPTPKEVAAFITDRAPDAYEKLVDRLLASPRHAEKQTMHWLDAVRYGDTAGFHGDNPMPTWPFRDYVLRSFLDNKPFDEFTREQIAGDLLPNATLDQKIASAYNRLNRVSAEGGLQPKEYLAKYAADRVRTTSSVWLGMTMGCAECHDHKFDPLLTRDFYSMKAFFADIKETGLVPDRGRDPFGSKLTIPTPEQEKQYSELNREIAYLQADLDEKVKATQAAREAWEKQIIANYEAGKLAWQIIRPVSAKSANGAELKVYDDEPLTVTVYRGGSLLTEEIRANGLVVAGGPNPDRETYTVVLKPGAGEWTSLGLQVVQDESLPADRFSRGGDRFVLSEVEAEVAGEKKKFSLATTDGFGQQIENHAMTSIDGDLKTGWGVCFGDGRDAFLALRFAQKLRTEADTVLTVRLRQESDVRKATIGRFRLALSSAEYSWPDHMITQKIPLKGLPADVLAALRKPEIARTEPQRRAMLSYIKWTTPAYEPLVAKISGLEAERDLLESQIPRVVVSESVAPRETRILPRGNFLDDTGDVVLPAIPVAFGKLTNVFQRATRLDLANWIVSKDNPLTARVFVNRMWRQFFGIGLSKALDDFGSQGEWPTHPELLDWLAAEFMHPTIDEAVRPHDWDVKHLIRLIVTSRTYRQPSIASPELEDRDPDNRLMARQSRFRVDAETVHDIALSVSGLLVEKFGGPSAKPYQPDRYLAALNFPVRDYSPDTGENVYRRGLYTHWQRSFLHPSLMTFDAPSREECTVNRVNSNTPLQALVLLNDPIYVEAARVFAEHAIKEGGPTPNQQIEWAFVRAVGRKSAPAEARILRALYAKSLQIYVRDPKSGGELLRIGDAPADRRIAVNKLAAMATVTRAILNLHETITRN